MFDSLSEENQLILAIVSIAILFAIVIWNGKRNKHKLYHRDSRDFRKNYAKKKKRKSI